MNNLIAALVLLVTVSGARAICLPYQPAHVVIQGELVRKTFPGRPNFASIADGDEAENGFYIQLTQPACTLEGASDSNDTARTGVHLVQLVLNQSGYDRLRPRLGATVIVGGTLFAPFTGHHHGDLLLDVDPPSGTAMPAAHDPSGR